VGVSLGVKAFGIAGALVRVVVGGPGPEGRPRSSTVLWAVRRDWPVDGTHEYIRARGERAAALRQLRSDRAYWVRSPQRPVLSVVRISAHEFALHHRGRRLCRGPDCPSADDRFQGVRVRR
jgi:hypothetical protein